MNGILADAVVLLHLAFVLFVVFGGLLVIRYRRLVLLHLPAAIWGAWIELSGGFCPLTGVENRLRQRAGEAGYESGFIEHYIYPMLYPPGLTRTTQLILGIVVIGLNLVIYGWMAYRWMLRRRDDQARRAQPR